MVRRIGSWGLNILIQLLAVPGVKDTQCGFKLFSAAATEEIFKRVTISRWSFDIEVLAIARSLGYKIIEVPIVWNDDPNTTLNPIKDGLKMFSDSWLVRKNLKKGLYK
ncbi:MAG: hypothetical protein NTW79_03180 [Candidatus Berkelbacteria bacterium]|nr:hypothetical protein [Candidatus Berkelbacteria bacterium]